MKRPKPTFWRGRWKAVPCCENHAGDPETWGLKIEGPPKPSWGICRFTAADAHLVAASPDLYDALDHAIDVMNSAGQGIDTRFAEAALAKARGEGALS